jgi:hypothetical protein
MRFGKEDIGCAGGKRYAGFSESLRPNFEYFLSCGIPGKMEGERYKKSPELVRKFMVKAPRLNAPKKYILFKRWDQLEAKEEPDVGSDPQKDRAKRLRHFLVFVSGIDVRW